MRPIIVARVAKLKSRSPVVGRGNAERDSRLTRPDERVEVDPAIIDENREMCSGQDGRASTANNRGRRVCKNNDSVDICIRSSCCGTVTRRFLRRGPKCTRHLCRNPIGRLLRALSSTRVYAELA